ncbi:uncharacterized protein [Miscanthus floridulus]|uniref:uncharacterized protein n=1 Tax=Miscanthus floridulus TaxID=154761 RepID=UPI0034590CBD
MNVGPFRRTSARTRRMATRMASALASSDNRAQAALARLEALESDNAGVEVVDLNDDEYGSTDEEDPDKFVPVDEQDYEEIIEEYEEEVLIQEGVPEPFVADFVDTPPAQGKHRFNLRSTRCVNDSSGGHRWILIHYR